MIEDIIYRKLMERVSTTERRERDSSQSENTNAIGLGGQNDTPDVWLADLNRYIRSMESTRQNFAFRRIYSCRKYTGGVIVFFKRVVRKLLKWYIEPICFQQTEFNNAVTPSIGRLTELSAELLSRTNQQQETNEKIEQRADAIQQKMEEGKRRIEQIESLNAAMREREQSAGEKAEELHGELRDVASAAEAMSRQVQVLAKELEDMRSMMMQKASAIQNLETDINFVKVANPAIFDGAQSTFFDKHTTSQSGEDSIVAYILMMLGYKPEDITYLDLGANHAKEMSNTYYFYRRGAKGVLVEANPALIPELKLMRHGDVVLNNCVAAEDGKVVDFFVVNGDGVSSYNKETVDRVVSLNENLEIAKTVQVETVSANTVMERCFGGAPTLLSIDIEGSDMEVLQSIDFNHYRPLIIVAETIPYAPQLVVGRKNMELVNFMEEHSYVEYAFTGINSIFIDANQLEGRASI